MVTSECASSSFHRCPKALKFAIDFEKKERHVGGVFSGRKPATTTKPCPEQFISLDIRRLQRNHWLEPDQTYNLHQYEHLFGRKLGIFSINTRKDLLEIEFIPCNPNDDYFPPQNVQIAWTPCHFGGYRPWFLCPGDRCDRRVAILYGPQPMLCRHCWRIAYPSQSENQVQRLCRRLRSVEANCAKERGKISNENLKRPKGMHHRTFQSLEEKQQLLRREITKAQVAELIKIEQALPDWY